MAAVEISSSSETGKIQVMHLKRYWNKAILNRDGKLKADAFQDEWKMDTTLLTALGIGLEQTIQYVYQSAPSFDEFENWILAVTGGPDPEKIKQYNQLIAGKSDTEVAGQHNLLTEDDHKFWQQNGYIIIRNAVTKEHCDQTIEALCNYIEIDRYNTETWYNPHPEKKGIMVQFFQHPALEQNRKAFKIRKAYEELWNRTDLWATTDRVSFNPPQTKQHIFQGPYLHWDASIKLPMPFGLQGLLYLSDTAENQGAFTLVPGFQNKIEAWQINLPPGADPRKEDLYALGAKPIAANAGDFVIWHHALPHGSSPNTSKVPRFVQYINYAPADEKDSDVWI
ncbi:MAG: phytanoyl-CoA dioxygenase PhyH [Mucilaginibacter sp.]|nr:phytanoyl-CoA dioxygenase PhyH [Mucilaginibacter sp.]